MNTLEFYLEHHYRLYFSPGGLFDRIKDLTNEQIRQYPNRQNSIAWLLWHIARCEDVGINRFVINQNQIIDSNNWYSKLNLNRKDIGTGMKYEEVIELSQTIEVNALTEYLNVVALNTQQLVKNLDSNDLDNCPHPKYVRKVLNDEGIINENCKWVEEYYINKTRGWFLGHLGLTHAKGHLSQILIIRKLQGLSCGGR